MVSWREHHARCLPRLDHVADAYQHREGLGQGAATAGLVADAIVEAARTAKARLAPARIGYGHTNVDLSVNRDLFNSKLEWRQEPNPAGSRLKPGCAEGKIVSTVVNLMRRARGGLQ